MKKKSLEDMDSVCIDCAIKAGYKPIPKCAGVWNAKCDICGEVKPTMSITHDFYPPKRRRK